MKRPFHSRVSRYVRVRRRLVARRSVDLSVESLGRSFVLHSVRKAQVAVAALQTDPNALLRCTRHVDCQKSVYVKGKYSQDWR